MITIGEGSKGSYISNGKDSSRHYVVNHFNKKVEENALNSNKKLENGNCNQIDNNNKRQNVTKILITNTNTEVIDTKQNHNQSLIGNCHDRIEKFDEYLTPLSSKNTKHLLSSNNKNNVNNNNDHENVNNNQNNNNLSITTTPKPKRFMRKIGKIMMPKLFLNENNNKTVTKNDPIIEDLLKKGPDKVSKINRIKSMFLSPNPVVHDDGPESADSGKENYDSGNNGVTDLKRQWSIRSDTKLKTPVMDKRNVSKYFGSADIEVNKNKCTEQKGIEQTMYLNEISSIHSNSSSVSLINNNVTPITPNESHLYDDQFSSYFSLQSNSKVRRLKQSTPLMQSVRQRIISKQFKTTRLLNYSVKEFDDITINMYELNEADRAFELLHASFCKTT